MGTLQEELERSFGDGPPLTPVEVRVAAGRRALVRRRAATGVAGLAVAALLAAGWYAVVPGEPRGTGQPATDPTPSTTQSPTADPTEKPWEPGTLIRYVDGTLQVRPGVTVHEHITNPYDLDPPALSDALDVTWKGKAPVADDRAQTCAPGSHVRRPRRPATAGRASPTTSPTRST